MRVLLAIIVSAIIAGLITIPPPKPKAPFAGPYTFCDKRSARSRHSSAKASATSHK